MRIKINVRGVICAVFMTILIVGCSSPNDSESEEKTYSQSTVEEFPLMLTLKIEEKEVSSIKDVVGTVSLRNISAKEKKLEFSTRCKYNYRVEKDGEILFDRIEHTNCTTLALSEWYLQPDQTHLYEFSLEWMPADIAQTIDEGEYKISAFLAEDNSPKVKTGVIVQE